MDKVLNTWIREFCGVMKGVDEKIDERVLRLFGHMENYRITKWVYVGECAGSRLVHSLWKRWIDTVKDYLKKKRFGCQARKENGAS